ncbi:MAG: TonB-dependent receptor [Sporomusaceae bacterium]|nr:TonB-dependent receptor [Sporomusaceae bacterium]
MNQTTVRNKHRALLEALIASSLIVGVSAVSYAAENQDYSFDQVVVTATKTPVKKLDANANINVITREKIEQNHYRDLAEALRTIPGVIVTNYGAGGEGYTANSFSINGTSQVVVLIDGIRANSNGSVSSTFQATEFNSLENVERIEVLKGSASTLYGSDAKGGVINIITRKADINKSTIIMASGSYGREDYSFANQGRDKDFSWFITSQKNLIGSYTDGSGREMPQRQSSTTNTVKVSQKINDASDITINYEKYQADYMRSGTNLHPDNRKYGTKDNDNLNLIYNYKFDENSWNQLSLFKNRNRLNDAPNTSDNWFMNLETRGIQDQFTKKLGDHTVVSGFDFYQDRIIDYNDSYSRYSHKTLTNRAFYLQDKWDMTSQWNLTSGIRQDNHSLYGNHTTPSVTLGYKQDDNTNYYVSYKEFFISPNQYQAFSPLGNLNLKPETGHTTEVGVEHKFDDNLIGAFHIFNRKSENVIEFDSAAWKYVNRSKENAHGWDMQLTKKWSQEFQTNIGYTHTIVDAVAGSIENRNGSLPKGAWNIDFNYDKEKYNVSLTGRGIIDKPGPKTATPSFPASTYWIWDMSVNYKLKKDATVFVKVNNMFNRYYAEYSNVNWGKPGEWYSSPGRNYQVGIQYQF